MKKLLLLASLASTSVFGGTAYTLTTCADLITGCSAQWVINYTSIANNFPGLGAKVIFTANNWTKAVVASQDVYSFDLGMEIKNTSSTPNPGGNIVGMGFSTTPDSETIIEKGKGKDPDTVIQQGDPNYKVVLGDTLLFKQVDYSTSADLPQVAKDVVDFCVWSKDGGGCNGAGNGNTGVGVGQTKTTSVRISYTNIFGGKFVFDSFYTRHQDLINGGSDVGIGGEPGTVITGVVPEPSFYAMLGLGCAGLIGAVRRKQNRA